MNKSPRGKLSTPEQRRVWLRANYETIRQVTPRNAFILMRDAGLFAPTSYWKDCHKHIQEQIAAISKETESTDMAHIAQSDGQFRRPEITEEEIDKAFNRARTHITLMLAKNGSGAWVSQHELLGEITEEYTELIGAIKDSHGNPLELMAVKKELLDITTAALFGLACIEAKKMDLRT